MEHLTTITPGADIVPITHPVYVEASRVQGTAIAMQHTGTADGIMAYLVVADNAQTHPVWVAEKDVSLAYIGERPS